MSGIVGLYRIDGPPLEPNDVEPMLVALAHRGPNGAGLWTDGPIGLGHRMLWTTPESLHERLPLVSSSGDIVLTADARIDNRDELIAALGFTGRPSGDVGDGELILGAYQRWGDACPERLLGDFAFAIWDRRRRRLFCARDPIGVRPFYYYGSGRVFAFASEIKALLCLTEVRREPDDRRVAEYLTRRIHVDPGITFYRRIFRLSPAHAMTVAPEGARTRAYWSLDPSRDVRLGSDAAYAEAFRNIFVDAVRSRLRSAFPVGSLLSGGLDSSAVTCVAERMLARNGGRSIHTFSVTHDGLPQCDERAFVHAVLAQSKVTSHFVDGDDLDPFTDVDRILWHQDEPFYAPGLSASWEAYRAAERSGVRVLLDGHDGDSAVSHGGGRLDELAQAGRWLSLVREARGFARIDGESPWKMIWGYVRHYSVEPAISRYATFHRAQRLWRGLFGTPPGGAHATAEWRALLDRDFVQRIDLEGAYSAWRETQPHAARSEREMHYRGLTAGLQTSALEVLDRAAAAFSIELRHPFWDRRLVEFCLGLPPEQKLHDGWSRIVLRRAMAGVLPREVQWRPGKTDFFPRLTRGLFVLGRDRLDGLILEKSDVLASYIDVLALRDLYRRVMSRPRRARRKEVLTIWRAALLTLWLGSMRMGGDSSYGAKGREAYLHRA